MYLLFWQHFPQVSIFWNILLRLFCFFVLHSRISWDDNFHWSLKLFVTTIDFVVFLTFIGFCLSCGPVKSLLNMYFKYFSYCNHLNLNHLNHLNLNKTKMARRFPMPYNASPLIRVLMCAIKVMGGWGLLYLVFLSMCWTQKECI